MFRLAPARHARRGRHLRGQPEQQWWGGRRLPANPQIDAEGFSSGALTGNYSVSYSGSAVGYNNGYPDSLTNPTASGCVFSPVFANVAASGTAALGVLKASASADMTAPLVGASAAVTEGYKDITILLPLSAEGPTCSHSA